MHHDRDVAAHQAEMEQLKAERALARAERQAKIDTRIDALRKKLADALERDRCKMLFQESLRKAKIQDLQVKADQSQGDIRRRLETRIANLRREYEGRAAAN